MKQTSPYSEREMLLALLEGALSEHEEQDLRNRLASDAKLKAALNDLESLRHVLASSRADSFGPYFSDRLMRRLRSEGQAESAAVTIYDSLQWVFARTAVAALVLVVLLSALNFAHYQEMEATDSLIESVFAIPSVSVVDALAAGGM